MKAQLSNYKPNIKSLTGKNVLEYIFNDDEIKSYQLGMLANNRIPGLLKSEVMRVDNQNHLFYDITSLVPVKKLFERRKLGRNDFLNLIRQLITLSDTLKEYLLDFENIVFDKDFIFADPQSFELHFVYIPVKSICNDLEPLKNLLLDSIIHDIQFLNESCDNYIQKLIEILKLPLFSAASLKAYMKEIENTGNKTAFNENHASTGYALSFEAKKEGMMSKPSGYEYNKSSVINKPQPVASYASMLANKFAADPTAAPAKKHTAKEEKVRKKLSHNVYPAKSYIVLASAAVILIVFAILLFITGTFSPGNPDFLLSLFGFLLMGGAVVYLIYNKLFSPYKNSGTDVKAESNLKTSSTFNSATQHNKKSTKDKPIKPDRDIPVVQGINSPANENMFYVNRNISISAGPSISKDNNSYVSSHAINFNNAKENLQHCEPQDKTVFLNVNSQNHPYLKRAQGSSEIVILEKFPFMVGRLQGNVDYCIKNPAVGKLHAEINRTSEGYFITDMNSKNGTIINGERIKPGQEYRISDQDLISFANEDFIFMEGRKS
jgi:hypothetical protein